MTVVSDSSPLITLARIDCLHLLSKVYGEIFISAEVYKEVVVDGMGLPGAATVAQTDWIDVRPLQDTAALASAVALTRLGAGELSTVLLAKELSADLVLIDERRARRYAHEKGLSVIGCVGILEDLYQHGHLMDLRKAYHELLQHGARLDLRTLQHSLDNFKLPRL